MKKNRIIAVFLVLTLVLAGGCAVKKQTGTSNEGNWRIITQEGQEDIKVLNLPDVRQATTYTCGVSALQAVLFYYGVEYRESALAEFAGSNENEGTPPEGILKALGPVNEEWESNFTGEIRQGATIEDIIALIDQEIPVIADIQAWKYDDTVAWKDDWIDGHYVVVIGYDEDNLYFEDPALINSVGSIPKDEFLDRWHDFEGAGDYDPETSVKTQNLIIVIRGETPTMFDLVLHID